VLTRGVIGSVLVLLGGLVVSVLPPSTPVLSIDLLASMRDSELGRMIGLAVVMVGLGTLGAAWLSLCRHVAREADHHDGQADHAAALGVAHRGQQVDRQHGG
jgi:hypothetical protein